jgi:hypothetical protein
MVRARRFLAKTMHASVDPCDLSRSEMTVADRKAVISPANRRAPGSAAAPPPDLHEEDRLSAEFIRGCVKCGFMGDALQ